MTKAEQNLQTQKIHELKLNKKAVLSQGNRVILFVVVLSSPTFITSLRVAKLRKPAEK